MYAIVKSAIDNVLMSPPLAPIVTFLLVFVFVLAIIQILSPGGVD